MTKYHAQAIKTPYGTFDSKREYQRFCELRLLERAGKISKLQRQVRFEVIPEARANGKIVERKCEYIADFVYDEDGGTVVEDCKGYRTPEYKIKRKLMYWRYGIRIRET